MNFTHYIAIGDSMSIDLYPYLDLGQGKDFEHQHVGAASLLLRNASTIWPEFNDRDLITFFPALAHVNLARDGATTEDVLSVQLPAVPEAYKTGRAIVTLTVAGNDVLRLLVAGRGKSYSALDANVQTIVRRYDQILDWISRFMPRATVLVNTIYDPSDGTGLLPGYSSEAGELPLRLLDEVNTHILKSGIRREMILCDVRKHFLGHGLSAPIEQRWYWQPNPIEPSARGASEIRRVWLNAILSHGLVEASPQQV